MLIHSEGTQLFPTAQNWAYTPIKVFIKESTVRIMEIYTMQKLNISQNWWTSSCDKHIKTFKS